VPPHLTFCKKMSFIEKAKSGLADRLLTIVTGALAGLGVIAANALAPEVIPILSSPQLQKAVVPILGISIILNLLLGLAIWQATRKPKFRTRFGFFWDLDLQPHCSACESPMQWGQWTGTQGPGLLCGKCKKPRYLRGEDGKPMSLDEAKLQLKKK
jgi:hypothetical protein